MTNDSIPPNHGPTQDPEREPRAWRVNRHGYPTIRRFTSKEEPISSGDYSRFPNAIGRKYLAAMSGSEAKVYLALAGHVKPAEETCFPSIATIQRETGLSRQAVITALARLEAKRLVYVLTRKQRRGDFASNFYTLTDDCRLDEAEENRTEPDEGSPEISLRGPEISLRGPKISLRTPENETTVVQKPVHEQEPSSKNHLTRTTEQHQHQNKTDAEAETHSRASAPTLPPPADAVDYLTNALKTDRQAATEILENLSLEDVNRWLEYVEADGERIRNPGGFIRSMARQRLTPPPVKDPEPQQYVFGTDGPTAAELWRRLAVAIPELQRLDLAPVDYRRPCLILTGSEDDYRKAYRLTYMRQGTFTSILTDWTQIAYQLPLPTGDSQNE